MAALVYSIAWVISKTHDHVQLNRSPQIIPPPPQPSTSSIPQSALEETAAPTTATHSELVLSNKTHFLTERGLKGKPALLTRLHSRTFLATSGF